MSQSTLPHQGHPRLSSVIAILLLIAIPSLPVSAQVYAQTSQSRQLETSVAARAMGLPDQSDNDQETSADLGGFNRSITSGATARSGSDPTVVAVGSAQAGQAVTYGSTEISGRMTASFLVESTGADAGAFGAASFETELRFDNDTPYRLSGRLAAGFNTPVDEGSRDAGGELTLFDLDLEDPHGGPTVLFGFFSGSDAAHDFPFDHTGVIPAGHRLVLRVGADAGRELLNNPPTPGAATHSGSSELTFSFVVPEPGTASIAPLIGWLLVRRHRSSFRPKTQAGS
jgi:hypothetical protein